MITGTKETRGGATGDVWDELRGLKADVVEDLAAEGLRLLSRAERGDLTPSERARLDVVIDDSAKINQQIDNLDSLARSASTVRVRSEPLTYNRHNSHDVSYFRDVAASDCPSAGIRSTSVNNARDRLHRHAAELDVEMPKRAAVRDRLARRRLEHALQPEERRLLDSPFERRENPNRTDGQGGYFVPPLWLIDEFIPGLRAGRVAAGLCRQMVLPQGTDSINIPKLSTLTAVGVQGSDGSGVTSQDITDTSVQANVKTLAGQADVAIQWVDQSPGHIVDQVIMADLIGDLNRLVDRQVVYGNGASGSNLNGGELLGLYPSTNWSGTNTVTYTQASPVASDLYSVFGASASKIATTRFDVSSLAFLVHPRRGFWWASGLDSSGRPLLGNQSNSFFNTEGAVMAEALAEGHLADLPYGPSVFIDGNVPTTDNGSGALTGTYDLSIAANWDDAWLFEGEMQTRVLTEVLSGTLEIRFQAMEYLAFLLRYGQSVALAQGSGFAAPTGAVSSITF